ncbi:hypothetical protein H9Y04_06580 [Streptomyces sp. TRM66268-LWL]|uniref:Uncharacterized protein n=1 Tax=Streptomyces polyasparticus TaxID=2767826 RepID=A0ABR7S9S1_9ACTN|nr:hypothetical protein [Streptomyces polyasparticus]MBC9712237.1 hypothetical protein [Streptomyces polyasparticus]
MEIEHRKVGDSGTWLYDGLDEQTAGRIAVEKTAIVWGPDLDRNDGTFFVIAREV